MSITKISIKSPSFVIDASELVRLRVKENRKIRAGGRIIYVPDEADDFDESDPDDDLEI